AAQDGDLPYPMFMGLIFVAALRTSLWYPSYVRRKPNAPADACNEQESQMPYLVAADLPSEPAGKRFRVLVERGGILQLPGAHNGMAALQAKAAGFEALYLSGAAMTASMGLPDLGVITVDEVTFFVRQVAHASGLPVLVDGDTGYGEALNV